MIVVFFFCCKFVFSVPLYYELFKYYKFHFCPSSLRVWITKTVLLLQVFVMVIY